MSLIGKRLIVAGADFSDIAIVGDEVFLLQSIAVTNQPTKMVYAVGETFDTTGMVVTATFVGETSGTEKTEIVSNYVYSPTTPLVNGNNTITISYTKGSITKTTTLTVTATEAQSYTITTTVSNGTYTGASSIVESSTTSVIVSANSGYKLPSSVTVSGATYTYSSSTGVILLSNPTDNVTITAVCIYSSVDFELVQGYWSGDSLPLANRVCNKTLTKGVQTITTKSGYVIRAVYAYTQSFTSPIESGEKTLSPYWAVPNGAEASASTTRTTYTTQNQDYWYGFTFAKTDASANISSTEDIIDSWIYS